MSLKSLKAKTQSAVDFAADRKPESTDRAPQRMVTVQGAQAFANDTIREYKHKAETAEARALELERDAKERPRELDLDALVEVEGRRRALTPEQYEELRENLRTNPLIHPVTVRPLDGGRFEIVSGANRARAFRDLGRTRISVSVLTVDDNGVERAAFFANLIQSELPDYEKYQGFARERRRTGKSQEALAKEAGVSSSALSMLFAFDELPDEALRLIETRPSAMGMSCAAQLAKATPKHGERVVEAVRRLVAGEITQKEAAKYAVAAAAPERRQKPPEAVAIKAGRQEYCRYLGRAASIRIDFKSPEKRAAAEDAIAEVLRRLAAGEK